MVLGARQARSAGGALLLVFLALWAFAAVSTGRDTADLLRQRTLGSGLGQPADAVITALQDERRAAVRFLARDGADPAGLAAPRRRTDAAVADLRAGADGRGVKLAAPAELEHNTAELTRRLGGLADVRASVDARGLDRSAAADQYTELVDAAFGVYRSAWTYRDSDLAAQGRAFVALLRAREQLAREDTLASGAFASGRLTAAEQLRFVELRSDQRLLLAEAAAILPPADKQKYQTLEAGQAGAALRAMEDKVAATGSTGAPPAGEAAAWQAAADPVLTAQRALVSDGVKASVDRATPGAVWTVLLFGVLGLLGLVAVLLAAAGWLRRRRALAGSPAEPASAAEPAAAPGRAAATGQPDVVLALEQRNQVLVRRQLDLLEAMQRRETGVDELADLFSADHLATRLRRNVEKAITLSGFDPGRRWRRPVPLLDVARAAAAEIEDYQRVTVGPVADADLAGAAVTDTVHLLAELIENAAAAAPDGPVRVAGDRFGDGYAIEVTDGGAGLSEEQFALLNDLVRDPSTQPATGQRQGLYVVARLAERRGLEVELYPARGGGTTARLLVPPELLAAHERRDEPAPPPPEDTGYENTDYENTEYEDPVDAATVGPDTGAGLPSRVPQPRRPMPPDALDDGEPLRQPPIARRGRKPEDVRRRLDAYRAQTLRGRGRAAQAADPQFSDAQTAEIPVNWVDPAGREER